jgi:hypothetical protein
MRNPTKITADRIPDSMPLYKRMLKKYPGRNPLLSAVHELGNPEDLDAFVKEYVSSLEEGGPNENAYKMAARVRKVAVTREVFAEQNIRYVLTTFKGEMAGDPGTEKILSQWEESLKKLKPSQSLS